MLFGRGGGHWYPGFGLPMISALVFQNQGGFPQLGASLPERDEYLRFTFSAAPAEIFGVQHAGAWVIVTQTPCLQPSGYFYIKVI